MNVRKILRFTRRIAREIKNTCLKKNLVKRVLWRIRQEIRKKAELKKREELYRKDYLENLPTAPDLKHMEQREQAIWQKPQNKPRRAAGGDGTPSTAAPHGRAAVPSAAV